MKIFIGLLDIASQLSDWKVGFKALGIETITASLKKQHVAQRNIVDIDLSKKFRPIYRGVRPRKLQAYLQDKWDFHKNITFRKVLKECDTFIFIGSSFFQDYEDFKIIKEKGKKLICVFTGDDSRWYYCMKQEFEQYGMHPIVYEPGYDYSIKNLEAHLTHLRNAEKYADVIVSIPNQAQMALRPYHLFYCALDLSMFPYSSEQREVPKIIHAPSSPHFKGTEHFLKAIDQLRNEGINFEFELVQGIPNDEAIRKYADADIILNQVFCPCGGKLAHEGMALGKVVLTKMGYDAGYDERTPDDCPLIDVNPDTVYQKLKEIILDVTLRKKLSGQGRAYVEKYNDAKVVAGRLLHLLTDNPAPDFKPTFFREHFIPESEEARLAYNKWNKVVAGCEWYRGAVGSFQRDGLEF